MMKIIDKERNKLEKTSNWTWFSISSHQHSIGTCLHTTYNKIRLQFFAGSEFCLEDIFHSLEDLFDFYNQTLKQFPLFYMEKLKYFLDCKFCSHCRFESIKSKISLYTTKPDIWRRTFPFLDFQRINSLSLFINFQWISKEQIHWNWKFSFSR